MVTNLSIMSTPTGLSILKNALLDSTIMDMILNDNEAYTLCAGSLVMLMRESRIFLYNSNVMAIVEKEYNNPCKKDITNSNSMKTNKTNCESKKW